MVNNRAPQISTFERDGRRAITAQIPGRRLALVAQHGWDEIAAKPHAGKHPEAEHSTVLFAHNTRRRLYPGMELLVTLLLHRCDDEAWSDEELFPIERLELPRFLPSGSQCGTQIRLRDGREWTIDFGAIDGAVG